MPKFSANLGFLWTELSLPDAIRAAKAAGFDAVELHWPYETPAADVKAALDETGLRCLGLNTIRGETNGLSAIPGQEAEARAAIDQAIDYGAAIGASAVHVMAGFASGDAARATFETNLAYACEKAAPHGITILIEPLNTYDAPPYFLTHTDQAEEIIASVGAANLKLMFDCYHVQIMGGDLTRRLARLLPITGHIQFADVPGRGAPGTGELNYDYVFQQIDTLGWEAPLGAEYKPGDSTERSLGWMKGA